MIPNHYIKNCCFTKHPSKYGCLGYQEHVYILYINHTMGKATKNTVFYGEKASASSQKKIKKTPRILASQPGLSFQVSSCFVSVKPQRFQLRNMDSNSEEFDEEIPETSHGSTCFSGLKWVYLQFSRCPFNLGSFSTEPWLREFQGTKTMVSPVEEHVTLRLRTKVGIERSNFSGGKSVTPGDSIRDLSISPRPLKMQVFEFGSRFQSPSQRGHEIPQLPGRCWQILTAADEVGGVGKCPRYRKNLGMWILLWKFLLLINYISMYIQGGPLPVVMEFFQPLFHRLQINGWIPGVKTGRGPNLGLYMYIPSGKLT